MHNCRWRVGLEGEAADRSGSSSGTDWPGYLAGCSPGVSEAISMDGVLRAPGLALAAEA